MNVRYLSTFLLIIWWFYEQKNEIFYIFMRDGFLIGNSQKIHTDKCNSPVDNEETKVTLFWWCWSFCSLALRKNFQNNFSLPLAAPIRTATQCKRLNLLDLSLSKYVFHLKIITKIKSSISSFICGNRATKPHWLQIHLRATKPFSDKVQVCVSVCGGGRQVINIVIIE